MKRGGTEPKFELDNLFATYLNHDHPEREDIRFFALFPLSIQDLWRSPPGSITLFT